MIRPTGDRVLVALPPREDETTSAGGIVLVKDPDRFYAPTRGIVVALGEKTGTVDLDDVLALIDACSNVDGTMTALEMTGLKNDAGRLSPAPFDVEVGDCVLFPKGAGEEIHDGGLAYVILREAEIIGVQEPLQKDVA